MLRECKHHGLTEFGKRKDNAWRCKKCQVTSVTERRRKVMLELKQSFGGCCNRCGYSKSMKALQFHHKEPHKKEFAISGKGLTLSIERLKAEASKCELVCANCHVEIHEEWESIVR